VKKVLEYFIESPHAAESGRQRNSSHRHSRFVNELLSKEHTPGLCHRDGRGSKMLHEQSAELALAYSQAFCQCFDACGLAVKRAVVNESQRAGNSVRSSAP
jgi:hypothetical protein